MQTEAIFENIAENIHQEIILAENSIYIAVAWFTNKYLFDALLDRANRGIMVNLIISNDNINENSSIEYERLNIKNSKVYKIGNGDSELMHHKFCVVDEKLVITGSYNWSYKANNNIENIVIHKDNIRLANQFIKEFNKIHLNFYHGEKLSSKLTKLNNIVNDFIPENELSEESIKNNQHDNLEKKWELIESVKKENLLKVLSVFNKNNLLIKKPFLLLDIDSTFSIFKETHVLESLIGFSELEKLRSLYILNSKVNSLYGLQDLNNLRYVHIGHNFFLKDIDVIKTCKNVELIQLQNCPITNPLPLSELPFLKSLSLSNNRIEDFSFVKNLNLNTMTISSSKLRNIDFLSTQLNLISLYLDGNEISDISEIAKFSNLESLSLSNNLNLKDLSPLNGLGKLKNLDISNTGVNSLIHLSSLPLKSLNITNTKVFDLSPLKNLNDLTLIWDKPYEYEIVKFFKPKIKLKHIHGNQYLVN
jgi:Leucine-rich repeat (LRR) protein